MPSLEEWRMRIAAPLTIRDADRSTLLSWTRSSGVKAGLAQRARIVLLAGEGVSNTEIAGQVGVSRPTVALWRDRYATGGLAALDDQPRSGRPCRVDEADIVVRTLEPPPDKLGVTHWSSRLLGRELGLSNVTVAKVWKKWDIQPWRTETFKFSTDPELDTKVRDVVGLYLNPPENAIVLCLDEKSQVQALDRTAPILPLRPRSAAAGHPRLRAPRHDHPVRRARGRHRQGHRRLLRAAPAPGVPALPQTGGQGLPAPRAASRAGQLRHPQAPRGARLAGPEPPRPVALHPHLRFLAEPRGDLLRDHHPASHPPRHLRFGEGPHRRHPPVHRRLERPLRTVRLDQAPGGDPRARETEEA